MVRRFAALPLLKESDIQIGAGVAKECVNELDAEVESDMVGKMEKLIKYMEKNWIGESPRFPKELWLRHGITGDLSGQFR